MFRKASLARNEEAERNAQFGNKVAASMKQMQKQTVQAVKEDVCQWINELVPSANLQTHVFLEGLTSGVVLIELMRALDPDSKGMGKKWSSAEMGSFHARDNISQFLSWMEEHRVQDAFETEDLAMCRNEKDVAFALLDVARKMLAEGFKGPLPQLVVAEKEIQMEAKEAKAAPQPPASIELEVPGQEIGKARAGDIAGLNDPLQGMAGGLFIVGHKRVNIRRVNNNIMVRTGGGWQVLAEFIAVNFGMDTEVSISRPKTSISRPGLGRTAVEDILGTPRGVGKQVDMKDGANGPTTLVADSRQFASPPRQRSPNRERSPNRGLGTPRGVSKLMDVKDAADGTTTLVADSRQFASPPRQRSPNRSDRASPFSASVTSPTDDQRLLKPMPATLSRAKSPTGGPSPTLYNRRVRTSAPTINATGLERAATEPKLDRRRHRTSAPPIPNIPETKAEANKAEANKAEAKKAEGDPKLYNRRQRISAPSIPTIPEQDGASSSPSPRSFARRKRKSDPIMSNARRAPSPSTTSTRTPSPSRLAPSPPRARARSPTAARHIPHSPPSPLLASSPNLMAAGVRRPVSPGRTRPHPSSPSKTPSPSHSEGVSRRPLSKALTMPVSRQSNSGARSALSPSMSMKTRSRSKSPGRSRNTPTPPNPTNLYNSKQGRGRRHNHTARQRLGIANNNTPSMPAEPAADEVEACTRNKDDKASKKALQIQGMAPPSTESNEAQVMGEEPGRSTVGGGGGSGSKNFRWQTTSGDNLKDYVSEGGTTGADGGAVDELAVIGAAIQRLRFDLTEYCGEEFGEVIFAGATANPEAELYTSGRRGKLAKELCVHVQRLHALTAPPAVLAPPLMDKGVGGATTSPTSVLPGPPSVLQGSSPPAGTAGTITSGRVSLVSDDGDDDVDHRAVRVVPREDASGSLVDDDGSDSDSGSVLESDDSGECATEQRGWSSLELHDNDNAFSARERFPSLAIPRQLPSNNLSGMSRHQSSMYDTAYMDTNVRRPSSSSTIVSAASSGMMPIRYGFLDAIEASRTSMEEMPQTARTSVGEMPQPCDAFEMSPGDNPSGQCLCGFSRTEHT